MTTAKNSTKAQTVREAMNDEFIRSAGEDLLDRLATVSSQFVHFAHDHEKVSFSTDPQPFSAYMAVETHYEAIGTINNKTLIIYKQAHSRESGYGLLHEGGRLRCQILKISDVVFDVMQHSDRKDYLDSLLMDIDDIIERIEPLQ